MGRNGDRLAQELGGQQAWTFQSEGNKALMCREAGLYNLSPLRKQGHTRVIRVFIYTGLCLNCLPLRRKKASQAPGLASALAAQRLQETYGWDPNIKSSSGP